jgi:hypothetical protein
VGDQDPLGLTVRADDAAVARVARRFAAAYVAAEEAFFGGENLVLAAARDAALADLLLVTGFLDAFDGTEHDDRPEALVKPDPEVL